MSPSPTLLWWVEGSGPLCSFSPVLRLTFLLSPRPTHPSTPFSLSVPLSGPYCVYLTAGTGGATVAWIWPLCTYRWWIHLWLCLHPEVTCHCLFSPQSTHTGRQFGQGSRGDWQVADPLQAQFTHCLNGRVVHPLSPFTLFN